MIIYILLTVVVVIALAWALFFRKTEAINVQPLTSVQKKLLFDHVDFYRRLDRKKKKRFEQMAGLFLADTRIEGVGTEVTELDQLLIASSAVIPIFGFPEWRYQNLTNIILYPDTFDGDFQFEGGHRNILGMVGSGYMNGQMLLSRTALMKAFSPAAGRENAALHEFVHLLDNADGATDGLPEKFAPPEFAQPWLQLMHREMHRIQEGHSDINPYALTNEAEFLAVTAEYFFEKPEKFKAAHPELYDKLAQVFAQRP